MEREYLKSLIEEKFSIREIVSKTSISYSTVRYWLSKYNLKTNYGVIDIETVKFCKICNLKKEIKDFYVSKGKFGSYCKKCSNNYHQNRVKDVKIKMINYKGGKCEHCSLKLEDTHYSVFELHHLNPSEKDPNFRKIKFQKWITIENEINKCKLLCANCHRLEHAKLEKWGE